jgi:hypothetical protein
MDKIITAPALLVIQDAFEQSGDVLLVEWMRSKSALWVAVDGMGVPHNYQGQVVDVVTGDASLLDGHVVKMGTLLPTLDTLLVERPDTVVVFGALHWMAWLDMHSTIRVLRWIRDQLLTNRRVVARFKRDMDLPTPDDQPSLLATLESMATCSIVVDKPLECTITHVKGSKVSRHDYSVNTLPDSSLAFEPRNKAKLATVEAHDVPTASFNLNLTTQQRQHKDDLVLPYTTQAQQSTAFYYDPDSADDFDEEDPDDDLLL